MGGRTEATGHHLLVCAKPACRHAHRNEADPAADLANQTSHASSSSSVATLGFSQVATGTKRVCRQASFRGNSTAAQHLGGSDAGGVNEPSTCRGGTTDPCDSLPATCMQTPWLGLVSCRGFVSTAVTTSLFEFDRCAAQAGQVGVRRCNSNVSSAAARSHKACCRHSQQHNVYRAPQQQQLQQQRAYRQISCRGVSYASRCPSRLSSGAILCACRRFVPMVQQHRLRDAVVWRGDVVQLCD
jgi:hypothetical protein